MKGIIDNYSGKVMLNRSLVTLYEDIDEFSVVQSGGELLARGELHIRWGTPGRSGPWRCDRTNAVPASDRYFEIEFFARFGFRIVAEDPQAVPAGHGRRGTPTRNGATLLLDDAETMTNTLGNTMMVLDL